VNIEQLKDGVRKSLPELEEIQDTELRAKVVDVWALALSETEFVSIDDIRASGFPTSAPLKHGTQGDHMRGVTRMALGWADGLQAVLEGFKVDRDILAACAICHDVGKPFEFSPRNQKRWNDSPALAGLPAIRHPAYGVHLALTVGLPEPVVHSAGYHSGEGELVTRSLEVTIVRHCDRAFWEIADRAGLLQPSE
jgi:23S rRNA maturation-related 3'-5' exoribonuclease YhaM